MTSGSPVPEAREVKPAVSEAQRELQECAQRTHEAIAAMAASYVALLDARKPGSDAQLTAPAATAYRNCERIVEERIKAEIQAHITLFETQMEDE